MKNFLSLFKRRPTISRNGTSLLDSFDLGQEMEIIQKAEETREIERGRMIHHFSFMNLDLRLDRDVTGTYRVTVNEGAHRLYSFTVLCAHRDYGILQSSYHEILAYLSGDRSVASLPHNEHLQGHFFGTGIVDK